MRVHTWCYRWAAQKKSKYPSFAEKSTLEYINVPTDPSYMSLGFFSWFHPPLRFHSPLLFLLFFCFVFSYSNGGMDHRVCARNDVFQTVLLCVTCFFLSVVLLFSPHVTGSHGGSPLLYPPHFRPLLLSEVGFVFLFFFLLYP